MKSPKLKYKDNDGGKFVSPNLSWSICKKGLRYIFGTHISSKNEYRIYISKKKVSNYKKLKIRYNIFHYYPALDAKINGDWEELVIPISVVKKYEKRKHVWVNLVKVS